MTLHEFLWIVASADVGNVHHFFEPVDRDDHNLSPALFEVDLLDHMVSNLKRVDANTPSEERGQGPQTNPPN